VTATDLPQVEQKRRPSRGGIGGVLVAVGALLLKFAKFLLIPLKLLKFAKFGTTFVSMAITIAIYASIWKWQFAVGVVALIFIHEMGHAGAMKIEGLRAGAPLFIPFLGAAIAMKDQPRDVLTEAKVAIAGPLVGACAAAVCLIPWHMTGNAAWLGLAQVGFFLNLFNLLPVSPLDGGRTVGAISRKLWYVGFALLVAGILVFHSLFLILVVLMALPQLRQNKARPPGYFDVPAEARAFIAFLYFGLAVALGIAMMLASERLAMITHRSF